MNLSTITAAQVGSAVRWAITTLGTLGAVSAHTAGLDWAALGSAAGVIASLLWSFWSNTKKVA